MRLVEVVMLMGAHCVSPVEHSQVHMMTDAAKVQCAVVIEKDTDKGTLTVTPQAAAGDPQVAAAVARFAAAPAVAPESGGATIVPAWAPAGSPATEVKPPIAPPATEAAATPALQPPIAPPESAAAETAAKPDQKVAVLTPPPPKQAPAKVVDDRKKRPARLQAAAAPKPLQCKAGATLKWYRTAAGQKKFHCVRPTGDSAPDQLY